MTSSALMNKVPSILSELNEEDINWLVEIGRNERVAAGTILIREGRVIDTLYILLEGILVVTISALAGQQIARLAVGEVVGEMSFIDARPPSATVQTLEDSLVLAIPRFVLAEKLQQDVAFAARFYRALAVLLSGRLRGTVRQLSDDKEDGLLQTGNQTTLDMSHKHLEQLVNRLKGLNS